VVAVPSWDAAFLVATNCGGDACKAAVKETIRTLADEWRPRLQPPVSPEGSEPQSP
jgi:hypothetical protein